MKAILPLPVGLMALWMSLAGSISASERSAALDDRGADYVSSPYFELVEGGSVDGLPLKSTDVKVRISGTIADVQVEQVYRNDGDVPLEARYVFPGSTRAAVHGLELQIGDRVVVAEIQEKKQAQATYDQAKREQKSAALLEQHRPNVFQMNVANIAPQSEVVVRLHYTETLRATERIYNFVFPTVVGPRYSGAGAAAEEWVKNPYVESGGPGNGAEAPTMPTFTLQVDVQAGMPLQSLTCATHDMNIQFLGADSARAQLKPGEEAMAGNRDVVLRYQLADKKVRSGLVLHQGKDENFFWLTVQPPERVTADLVPPREYVFVVDVSGSMGGFPLNTAKALLTDLLAGLRPVDRFNVMVFASASEVLAEEALPATRENRDRALRLIDHAGGGGTELLPALERCFKLPGSEDISRSIVVITDGYVDCERRAFDLVRGNLGQANLFAFGIGSSVNRFLIEGLARMGQGEPFVVLKEGDAPAMAKQFRQYIESPVMTDVKVEYDGWATSAVEPLSIPDVFADRPIEILGKWEGLPQGRVKVTGLAGAERVTFDFDVANAAAKGKTHPALATLWARERVKTLSDYAMLGTGGTGEVQKEITELGLKYELLTEFTSFVAVDKVAQPLPAAAQTVSQPLPLPAGVSTAAAGGKLLASSGSTGTAGTTPEPGRLLLLIIGSVVALLQRQRGRAA